MIYSSEFYTTLKKIRDARACKDRYAWLVSRLDKTVYVDRKYADDIDYVQANFPDDDPISLTYILDNNGLDDALWALRACDGSETFSRLLVCLYAEDVLPIFEAKCISCHHANNAVRVILTDVFDEELGLINRPNSWTRSQKRS